MSDDTEPIVLTVPETVSVDTGADKAQLGNLQADFQDFWKEQDEAPAAPTPDGAAQETVKQIAGAEPKAPKEPSKPQPEPKPTTPLESKAPAELTDDEIGRMELPPNAREEHKEHFKRVKEMLLSQRAKLKAGEEQFAAMQQQLAEARAQSMTPELKADYEHAASVRRRVDYVSDPEFVQRYQTPIRTQYEEILEEAFSALPDKQAAREWVDYMKQNYHPDQLNRDWWLRSVIHKVPNELDRSSLQDSVTKLLKLQKDRDQDLYTRTQDGNSFDSWIKEKTERTAHRVQEEIMAEIGEQEKRIAEVLPRDPESAKTTEEREAIVAHNERFTKLNEYFVKTMKDLSAHGPRAWVRASVEATRSYLMDGQIRELEKELQEVKAQRDQYKNEIDKIAGARRRLSQTTAGTPPSAAKRSMDGLSVKDLDVRKAFDSFDWGETR